MSNDNVNLTSKTSADVDILLFLGCVVNKPKSNVEQPFQANVLFRQILIFSRQVWLQKFKVT